MPVPAATSIELEINPLAGGTARGEDAPAAGEDAEEHIPQQGTEAVSVYASTRAQRITVREVCKHRLSAHFTHDGRVESIWGKKEFNLAVQELLGKKSVITVSKLFAALFLANTLIEVVLHLASTFQIWTRVIQPISRGYIFGFSCLRRTLYRQQASKGGLHATEHWWIVTACVMALLSFFSHRISVQEIEFHKGTPTIYGKLSYEPYVVVLRVARGYFLVFWSRGVRDSVIIFVKVCTRLTGVMALLLISFVLHYFMMQLAFAYADDDVVDSMTNKTYAPFKDNADGLFTLYVGLTTANHPDFWMPMYHSHWYLQMLLISFMTITNIYLLNIFLAHTSMVYARVVKETFEQDSERKNIILNNLFLDWAQARNSRQGGGQNSIHPQRKGGLTRRNSVMFAQNVHQIERQPGMSYREFELLMSMRTPSSEHTKLWFNLLDVNSSGTLSLEEFTKLPIMVRAPFTLRSASIQKSKPLFPKVEWFYFHAKLCHKEDEAAPVCDTHEFTECGVHSPCLWNHPLTYSGLDALINLVTLFQPLLWRSQFPSRDEVQSWTCDSESVLWWKFFLPYFAFDIVLTALAWATELQPFAWIWPVVSLENGKKKFMFLWVIHVTHMTDIAFVFMVGLALFNVCVMDGDNVNWTVILALLRVIKCGLIVVRLPATSRAFHAAIDCVVSIRPVAATFLIIYYSFACIGCAAFAGCVTETGDGKPADWSTPPWSNTTFGQADYYYDLNFDNMYSAVCTLFMLTIQNNWHVTVDGYVMCTGTRYTRLFFITFNVVIALVMLNLLTGVLLEMYAVYFHDTQEDRSADVKEMYDVLVKRLEKVNAQGSSCSEQPAGLKRQKTLCEKWDLTCLISSRYVLAGATPSDEAMLGSERHQKDDDSAAAQAMLWAPMPVYCRAQDNKIVYCNKLFASLYGKKQNDLEGFYENYMVEWEHKCSVEGAAAEMSVECKYSECGTSRERERVHYWKAHQLCDQLDDLQKVHHYNEPGVLKDGTKVRFECSESLVHLEECGVDSPCTVVYMLPMDEENNMLGPLEIMTHQAMQHTVKTCPAINSFTGLCLAVEAGNVLRRIPLDASNTIKEVTINDLTFRRFYKTHRIIKHIPKADCIIQVMKESLTAELWKEFVVFWPKFRSALLVECTATIIFAERHADAGTMETDFRYVIDGSDKLKADNDQLKVEGYDSTSKEIAVVTH